MDEVPEYDGSGPGDLEPCSNCGRTFLPDSLARHERICQKNVTKKRKVFDSSKMRAQGTELASFKQKPERQPPSTKKNNWRRRHEEFVEAMRAARGVSHAMKTGAPLPPPPAQKRVNPDYVQCPSCERHFKETAAERHIPWCKEKNKRMDKRTPSASEKNKVIARTKYKPPLPGSKKKQQSSPGVKATQSRITRSNSARSPMDHDVADMTSRMNGGMKLGNRTNVRNKPYTGSKVRSASPARPSPKASPNASRSSSGDSYRGRGSRESSSNNNRAYQGRVNVYSDYDDDDLDFPDSRQGSAGRRLEPLTSKQNNHYLPHDRLKVVSDESDYISSRTPTPPSSRPSPNVRKTSADIVNGRRMPKFCHECGTRYPVSNAKFCCECGTRRVAIE